ncbi:MFS transporter [Pseudonocardia sp. ICBG1293]|uniref:MFS transporter n=1 Tax=Pseudonocardia sp. ICBG1293 TaxID=2844382 RepID=UPI001CCE4281|nr:MFS transporter [Pseudonocardia sp. ICBG1293]
MAADVGRVVVVAVVVALVASSSLTITALVVAGLALGACQTVFDTGSQASVPQLAGTGPGVLERANSRIVMVQTVNAEFVGPPLGGLLFTAGAALAFTGNAAGFALSALLLAPLLRRGAGRTGPPVATGARGGLFTELLSGLRFLLHHSLLRTLTVTTALVNISFAAVESLLVVYADQRLGLDAVGFGLLFAPLALGGLGGAAAAPRIAQAVRPGPALLGALVVLAGALLLFAVATTVPIAVVALVLAGACIAVYNVLGQSVRQAVTPPDVLGRVVAAFRMVALGAVPIGAVAGGLAARVSLALPYALGAGVLVLTTLLVGRVVARAAITAPAAGPG